MVDLAHPYGIAAGQIFVHGNDMHAFSREGVQVDGSNGRKRLSFAGHHFRDRALMDDHAADQLDIIWPLMERALGGFAGKGECRGENIVERFSRRHPSFQFRAFCGDIFIAKRAHVSLRDH